MLSCNLATDSTKERKTIAKYLTRLCPERAIPNPITGLKSPKDKKRERETEPRSKLPIFHKSPPEPDIAHSNYGAPSEDSPRRAELIRGGRKVPSRHRSIPPNGGGELSLSLSIQIRDPQTKGNARFAWRHNEANLAGKRRQQMVAPLAPPRRDIPREMQLWARHINVKKTSFEKMRILGKRANVFRLVFLLTFLFGEGRVVFFLKSLEESC
ncbi:hypothetical protein CEXT_323781 [Caerostris extrusa]|uniref:Uncharacterized protein n=1 Tax=Caerostris extrusa TaxID=172846 RepID=A0AAV4XAD9_CAEEX|nr:hypothetical protein CEXT_323781 [Caerostris extrusa]